jgi:adenosine deaminase
MTTYPRDRFDYSSPFTRPKLKLPGKGRMIVWSVVNIEEWEITRPMARQLSIAPQGQSVIPDMPNWTWYEYGMRVGFWRLMRALKKAKVTPTMSLNAKVCETYPEATGAARDAGGVSTLEIRFAPQLHGHPIGDVIDAALDGIAGRAGLILCALYGEDPADVKAMVEIGAEQRGVVALDLAGGPAPGHAWDLESYGPAFQRAAERGLGATAHVGEGRPAAEIATAIRVLGVQRIGHGTSLLDDADVLELVLARGVTIEACPTSNVHTGVIARVDDHPLPRWLSLGVKACINTDNTLFSDVTAAEEHARARAIPGMTDELLERAVVCGHRAAFTR